MKNGPWKFYLGYYRGSGPALAAAAGLSVLQSLLVLPVAYLVRMIFDRAFPEQDTALLLTATGAIVAVFLAEAGLTLGARSISLRTTKLAIRRIRDDIIGRIYTLPRTRYASADRRQWQARIVQGTLRIDIMSNAFIVQFLPAAVAGLGLSLILIALDARLFMFLLLPAAAGLVGHRILSKRLKMKIRAYHSVFEVFSKRVLTLLHILDLTHARAMENKEAEAQRDLHAELKRKSQSQAWSNAFYQNIQRSLIVSGGAVILFVGGQAVLTGRMTIGGLMSFFAAAGLLRNSLLTLTSVIPQILEGREAMEPLMRFFEPDEKEPQAGFFKGSYRGECDGSIDLEDIHFRYRDRPLLEGVTLSIRPGEIVGLTGPNGSGKSTIGYLVMGFYAPQKGRIKACGRPYETWDLRHLRRFIGHVPQDPVLFPGTIAENIAYGESITDRERIVQAAEWASCREFIERLPEGFNTHLKDPAVILSGGELQKISLARAVGGRPRLLLLDEPNNHLDPVSLARLLMNLKRMEPCPAILLISQNRSVLESADNLLELQDGRIVKGIMHGLPNST
jgi:ABC-type multidrug transport system fused ATPase/permease subunit